MVYCFPFIYSMFCVNIDNEEFEEEQPQQIEESEFVAERGKWKLSLCILFCTHLNSMLTKFILPCYCINIDGTYLRTTSIFTQTLIHQDLPLYWIVMLDA